MLHREALSWKTSKQNTYNLKKDPTSTYYLPKNPNYSYNLYNSTCPDPFLLLQLQLTQLMCSAQILPEKNCIALGLSCFPCCSQYFYIILLPLKLTSTVHCSSTKTCWVSTKTQALILIPEIKLWKHYGFHRIFILIRRAILFLKSKYIVYQMIVSTRWKWGRKLQRVTWRNTEQVKSWLSINDLWLWPSYLSYLSWISEFQ